MLQKCQVNIPLAMNHVSNKSLSDLPVSPCANSKIEKPSVPAKPFQLCLLSTRICILEKQNTHVVSSICVFSLEWHTHTHACTHDIFQYEPDVKIHRWVQKKKRDTLWIGPHFCFGLCFFQLLVLLSWFSLRRINLFCLQLTFWNVWKLPTSTGEDPGTHVTTEARERRFLWGDLSHLIVATGLRSY